MTTQNSINISSPFSVANGGTGLSTLTLHGILYGNGAGNVSVSAAMNNGQVLIGSSGAAPVPGLITSSDSSLQVNAGAGTLDIVILGPVSAANGGLGVANPTAHGILVAQGASAASPKVLTNGQLLVGSTGADPVAATITAGAGISVTNGAGTITIANTAAGEVWNDTTGTTATLASRNGYQANNVGTVTFTLPATAAVGDVFEVVNVQGGFQIAQNASQSIRVGNQVSTTGVGGSISSSGLGDWIEIRCTTANTGFFAHVKQGTVTIV